jgi:hypothetical protein
MIQNTLRRVYGVMRQESRDGRDLPDAGYIRTLSLYASERAFERDAQRYLCGGQTSKMIQYTLSRVNRSMRLGIVMGS